MRSCDRICAVMVYRNGRPSILGMTSFLLVVKWLSFLLTRYAFHALITKHIRCLGGNGSPSSSAVSIRVLNESTGSPALKSAPVFILLKKVSARLFLSSRNKYLSAPSLPVGRIFRVRGSQQYKPQGSMPGCLLSRSSPWRFVK